MRDQKCIENHFPPPNCRPFSLENVSKIVFNQWKNNLEWKICSLQKFWRNILWKFATFFRKMLFEVLFFSFYMFPFISKLCHFVWFILLTIYGRCHRSSNNAASGCPGNDLCQLTREIWQWCIVTVSPTLKALIRSCNSRFYSRLSFSQLFWEAYKSMHQFEFIK